MTVELTDTGILVSRRFKSPIEIPYHSIIGCTFESSDNTYGCNVKYKDKKGKDKDKRIAKSHDKLANDVYIAIIKNCEKQGHKIKRYPSKQMRSLKVKFENFGVMSEFIEPDVDEAEISYNHKRFSDSGSCYHRIDIGGLLFDHKNIEKLKVIKYAKGRIRISETSGGWYIITRYNYDYTIRCDSNNQIDCIGHPLESSPSRIWTGTDFAQILNKDGQLGRMLIDTRVPELHVKGNQLSMTIKQAPSPLLFRCIERIAEHVCNEAGN